MIEQILRCETSKEAIEVCTCPDHNTVPQLFAVYYDNGNEHDVEFTIALSAEEAENNIIEEWDIDPRYILNCWQLSGDIYTYEGKKYKTILELCTK